MRNFEDAFYEFRARVKELDRRLSSIIIQGFDDCSGLINRFRLFDSFDLLLLRPIISEVGQAAMFTHRLPTQRRGFGSHMTDACAASAP